MKEFLLIQLVLSIVTFCCYLYMSREAKLWGPIKVVLALVNSVPVVSNIWFIYFTWRSTRYEKP